MQKPYIELNEEQYAAVFRKLQEVLGDEAARVPSEQLGKLLTNPHGPDLRADAEAWHGHKVYELAGSMREHGANVSFEQVQQRVNQLAAYGHDKEAVVKAMKQALEAGGLEALEKETTAILAKGVSHKFGVSLSEVERAFARSSLGMFEDVARLEKLLPHAEKYRDLLQGRGKAFSQFEALVSLGEMERAGVNMKQIYDILDKPRAFAKMERAVYNVINVADKHLATSMLPEAAEAAARRAAIPAPKMPKEAPASRVHALLEGDHRTFGGETSVQQQLSEYTAPPGLETNEARSLTNQQPVTERVVEQETRSVASSVAKTAENAEHSGGMAGKVAIGVAAAAGLYALYEMSKPKKKTEFVAEADTKVGAVNGPAQGAEKKWAVTSKVPGGAEAGRAAGA